MPELPEVETIVRALGPRIIGRTVTSLACDWPAMLRPHLGRARTRVVGRRIARVERRAKLIVISFFGPRGAAPDGTKMLIHLRMSGRLAVEPASAPANRHVHFRMGLSDGLELRFPDARKFGRVVLTRRADSQLARLGVEPLGPDFTVPRLAGLLAGRSRRLKPLLLDQSVIAGLGNIYVDEALHRAGLHPLRRSNGLRRPEVLRLYGAIRAALEDGIRHNGASIDWVYPGGRMQEHFRVYGRGGDPCPACGRLIQRIVLGQRGTHFCPACQRLPRDRPRRRSVRIDTTGGRPSDRD